MTGDQNNAVPTVYAIDTENDVRQNRENNKPKKKHNKGLVIMVILIVILFAALFATLFVLYRYMYPKSSKSNGNICDSHDCIRMAAAFKRTMDSSVDPCDNFVNYACGKWSQSYLKPDAYFGYSWFEYIHRRQTRKLRDLLQQNLTDVYGAKLPRAVLQMQKLYHSCTDTDTIDKMGLDPIVNLLKEFNLPKLPPAFREDNNSTDLVRQAAKVKRFLYKDVFFKVEVYADLRNVSKNLIVIGSPTSERTFRSSFNHYDGDKIRKYFKIMLNDFYSQNDTNVDENEKILMTRVIRDIVNDDINGNATCKEIPEENEKQVEHLVEEIVKIKDYIFQDEYNSSENETFPFGETYEYDELPEKELMYVDTLQKLTDEYVRMINPAWEPQEIWKPFIEELFKYILKPKWRTRYKLWVYDLKHLQRVALLFANTDKKLLETVTWWTVVHSVTPYGPKSLRDIWSDYVKQMYKLENTHSRSIQCVSVVNNLMGIATSWLYFDKSFNEEEVPRIKNMVGYMKSAFADLIIKSDWLDRKSQMAILRKNSKPISAVGYPEWLYVDGKVDEFYTLKLSLSESDFLANVIQLVQMQILTELKNIYYINNMDEEFWIEPVVINAFHSYEHNQIIIPASILKFPFYTSSLNSVNYGFIGASVIGHELAHGFDDLGRRFDEFGNLKQWWSNETIAEYVSKAKCYVNHYNEYYIEEANSYVNGKATLNENLADVLGLKQAFVGYQQWKERHEEEPKLSGFTNLTHEQLFFLSYGVSWCQTYTPTERLWEMSDTHAPSDIRILGVLRNSKEFSDAWQCPVGSYMNPEDKCTLW